MKAKVFLLLVLAIAAVVYITLPQDFPSSIGQPAEPSPLPSGLPAVPEEFMESSSIQATDAGNTGAMYMAAARELLTLYPAPDAGSQTLAQIPAGDTVTVFGYTGAFAHVRLNSGLSGYVHGALLDIPADQPIQMLAGDIYRVYADSLSLRISSDSMSECVMRLDSGALLRILDTDNSFARVEAVAYGQRGYVMTDYLTYATGQQLQPMLENQSGFHAVICRKYVTLRTAPDTAADAVLTLGSGARVRVIGYDGDFANVAFNDLQGYLLSDYLTPVSGDPPQTPDYQYIVCTEPISMRTTPDITSKLVQLLPSGERVSVIGRHDGFSKVKTDTGEMGYVHSVYLSEIADEMPLGLQQGIYQVVCNDFLTLRDAPAVDAKSLAQLNNGSKVELLGLDGQFAKVCAGSQTGFVRAGYLKADHTALSVVRPMASYSYDHMMADLSELAETYGVLTLDSIGKSANGRDIPVMRIGNEEAKHHILIQGGIHGREHMTSLLLTALIEYTAANPDAIYAGTGAEGLLDGVCLHVLPMTNPDGVAISQTAKVTDTLRRIYDSDTAAGLTSLDISEYLLLWKSNANGIDINRNFDAGWANIISPAAPSFTHYKGSAPFDQPETQALAAYTRACSFDATISYHASGSVIYWQYGEDRVVNALSKDLGFALRACTKYPLSDSDGLDGGGYKDWAVLQHIPSVTVEIGTRPCPLPFEEFSTIWARNKSSLLAAARWVKRGQ